jgi:hypothetical protein
MRGGAYFLEHARRTPARAVDPHAEFEFRATETEGIIWWPTQNAGVVDTISSEAIFQVWFLARRVETLARPAAPRAAPPPDWPGRRLAFALRCPETRYKLLIPI